MGSASGGRRSPRRAPLWPGSPPWSVFPALRVGGAALAVVGALLLAGCGDGKSPSAKALTDYLSQIEPLRLAVNSLLGGADPILSAYREHRISPLEAQRRFDRLERSFASYTERIAAIEPRTAELRRAHGIYLHTYFLEDAYLSSLTNALPSGKFDELPHTEDKQRAAIIEWRTDLSVLAARAHVRLPQDLQIAGRGEIAPSPTEESAGGS
jgi:hypothetical protein